MNEQYCAFCGLILENKPGYSTVLDYVTNERFSILFCRKCAIGQTIPLPKQLERYYTTSYYGNRHGATKTLYLKSRSSCIQKAFRRFHDTSVKQRKLLDIGCGDGSFLKYMSDQGWDVAGVEINPESARQYQFPIFPRVEELLHQKEKVNFDCITLWHSFEHLPYPIPTLAAIKQILTPQGVLIISIPVISSFQARLFRSHWLHADVPRHVFHYSENGFQNLLKTHGFKVRALYHREFEYDLFGWIQSFLTMVVKPPNLLFSLLTGKEVSAGKMRKIIHLLITLVWTPLACIGYTVSKIAGKSATMTVISQKEQE
ncbi:MAG: class I SAM-dependent methyltransferase [Chitinivibrionales bacterium]|nr:class I SAM-dependent methyltransferase [Chitinivibrionales bacterium]